MKTAFIYRWRNIVNDKCYYGSTVYLRKRYVSHLNPLKLNKHGNKHLQSAWNLYGEQNFRFEIVEENISIESQYIREQWWLDFTKCYLRQYGYNLSPLATGGTETGCACSIETRNKISLKNAGRKMKDPVWNKGKTKETDERVASGANNNRGQKRCMPEEERAKHRGGHRTEEQRKKMRKPHKPFSEEHNAKLRGKVPANKGKKLVNGHYICIAA